MAALLTLTLTLTLILTSNQAEWPHFFLRINLPSRAREPPLPGDELWRIRWHKTLSLSQLPVVGQHGHSSPLAAPYFGPSASSGCAWRLWAAQHSQEEEAGPLSYQPLPRVLEPAAPEAVDSTAFDHSGRALLQWAASDPMAAP